MFSLTAAWTYKQEQQQPTGPIEPEQEEDPGSLRPRDSGPRMKMCMPEKSRRQDKKKRQRRTSREKGTDFYGIEIPACTWIFSGHPG